MLICNNCNAAHTEVSNSQKSAKALVCQHCNMSGNFRQQGEVPPNPNDDNLETEKCWNCGKITGQGNRCLHCNIPLSVNRTAIKQGKKIMLKANFNNNSDFKTSLRFG